MKPNRPNVVLITTDQHRFDAMRAYGNPFIYTPHMDNLAMSGVRFTRAYSECPCCVPARRCLMTGKSAYANHQYNNSPQTPFDTGPWLAEVFGDAGYQTFAVGKLHVSPLRMRIGFDDVILNEEGRRQDTMNMDDYDMYLHEQGLLEDAWLHATPANGYHARPHNLPERHMQSAWTAREACRFISRRDPTRPFFLYVSFRDPHPSLAPPQAWWDFYRDRPVHQPVTAEWNREHVPQQMVKKREAAHYRDMNDEDKQRAIRAYYGLVSSIDQGIGQLMGHLREHWCLGRTVFVFTADHGEMLFDHDTYGKGLWYEGSAHVPMIVVPSPEFHGDMPRDVTCGEPMLLQDVMPTLLDLCNIDIPDSVEGASMAPAMRGEKHVREHVFGEFGDTGPGGEVGPKSYMLTDGHQKYIYDVEGGLEQLFDIDNDPSELHNLALDVTKANDVQAWRAKLVERLRKRNDSDIVDGKLAVVERRPVKRSAHDIGSGHAIHWPTIPYHDFAPESLVEKFDSRRAVWAKSLGYERTAQGWERKSDMSNRQGESA